MTVVGSRKLLIALALCALVVSGVAYAAATVGSGSTFASGVASGTVEVGGTAAPEDASGDGREDTKSPEEGHGEAKKANFDPRDERQLVGGSDDVFFGRVVERTGSEKAPPIGDRQFREPQTQYAVEVTQAIEGGLSGTITVNRRGGSPGAPDAPGGGSLLERRGASTCSLPSTSRRRDGTRCCPAPAS